MRNREWTIYVCPACEHIDAYPWEGNDVLPAGMCNGMYDDTSEGHDPETRETVRVVEAKR